MKKPYGLLAGALLLGAAGSAAGQTEPSDEDELRGRISLSIVASLVNVAFSPLLGYFVGRSLGLDPTSLKVAVIFLSCPTAVFSYVLAEMLGNDGIMARNIVILSTLLSIVSLVLAIALL